jgi:hypothetical protein
MDGFSNIILNFEEHMKTLVYENVVKQKIVYKHSHKPMKGIVSTCPYCIRYGNIFENGPISEKMVDVSFLQAH